MGYKINYGSPEKKQCGMLWWKKTCCWIETGERIGSYEEWFDQYPVGDYPMVQMKCTTCGKTKWK